MTADIRPASDADGAAVCALIAAVFTEYPGCVFEISEMPELLRPCSAYHERGGAAWVAATGNNVLGFVGAVPAQNGRTELKNLYVAASARGTGLGRLLIARVEAFARERGDGAVHLWSDTRFERAHAVYAHCGYERLSGTRELHDLSNSIEFHFEKALLI